MAAATRGCDSSQKGVSLDRPYIYNYIPEFVEFCEVARRLISSKVFCAAKPYLLSLLVSSPDSRLITLFGIFLGLGSGYYVPSFLRGEDIFLKKIAMAAVEVSISYQERKLISTRMLDATSARFSMVLGSLNLVPSKPSIILCARHSLESHPRRHRVESSVKLHGDPFV